jgi:hypothetical protein
MQRFELGQQPGLGLLQRLVGDVRLLVIGGVHEASETEYDAHIVEAMAMAPSVRVVIVALLDDSAGLSQDRRAKLARARLLDVPTAVLTASIRIHGMLTPINWLGGKVKPFAPRQFEEACEFLEIPSDVRANIREQMTAMCTELCRTGADKKDERRSRSGTFAAVRRAVAAGFAKVRKRSGGDSGRRF